MLDERDLPVGDPRRKHWEAIIEVRACQALFEWISSPNKYDITDHPTFCLIGSYRFAYRDPHDRVRTP